MCGYPLPHDYRAPFGCILNSIQREGESVIHSFHLAQFILTTLDQPPRGISSYHQCDFFTENFVRAYCNVEHDTHTAVRNRVIHYQSLWSLDIMVLLHQLSYANAINRKE